MKENMTTSLTSRANLFIVGPSKTGTTSLFRWLQQHPDIQTAKGTRNVYFFYEFDKRLNKGFYWPKNSINEYNQKYYPEVTKKIVLESCDYLYSLRFHLALKEGVLGKNPKIIVIDRDPIDRLRSSYEYYKYGQRLVNEDIETYIRKHAWEYNTFQKSVQNFIDNGGDVKVIKFQQLQNPNLLMEELYEWLGIQYVPWSTINFEVHNKTRGMKFPRLHDFFYKIKTGLGIQQPMPKCITSIYLRLVTKKQTLTSYEKSVFKKLVHNQEYRKSLGLFID